VAIQQVETPARRNELSIAAGNVIFRQGDPGDSMFIVERGRVRIVLACEGQESEVAVLGAGDFFGELSLLSGAARTATAVALEDTTLLVVRRRVFAMMMQDDLTTVFRMLHAMGERLDRTDRQFWSLMRRHGRLRLLAEGLRHAGATMPAAPVVLEVDRLAADLRLDLRTVHEMLGELSELGAGALADGRWRLDRPEHLRRVIELVGTYAARGDT